jgi:aspartyl protease family protein
MRQILIFAALALAIGVAVPKLFLNQPAPVAVNVATQQNSNRSASGVRSVTLFSNRGGHYQTDAMIGSQRISFLVDTGATMVTLRESDAARLGIRPQASDYNLRVGTANGTARAARAWVSRIDVGDITVHDVTVTVMPDSALGTNLLGMSFLSRVRIDQQNGKLVMEQ